MRITARKVVKSQLPGIPEAAHKCTRGRLLLVWGSYGMAGAAIMAVRAALRTGAGFTDLAIPKALYPVAAAAVPESVITVYNDQEPAKTRGVLLEALEKADAVVMGCGLGKLRETVCPVILENCRKPLVLDADALNLMARTGMRPVCPEMTVLTPHEGEMGRLLGVSSKEICADREGSLLRSVSEFGTAVLLKGPGTLITAPDAGEVFMNPTGNAGMARAGSGDVLSGMTGALAAQGMDVFHAAVCGAYLHGAAGDIASKRYGQRSMLPTDLIECVPEALMIIEEDQ